MKMNRLCLICSTISLVMLVTPISLYADVSVVIDHYQLTPKEVLISPGEKITWLNNDPDTAYQLVSADNTIMSNYIIYGQVYIKTFTKPGVYTYYASNFPSMTGVVTVKPIKQLITDVIKQQVKPDALNK